MKRTACLAFFCLLAGLAGLAASPSTRAGPAAAGLPDIGWALYTDESYGFTLRYPRSWQVTTPLANPGAAAGVIEQRRLFLGPDGSGVNLDVFLNPDRLPLEAWFERYQARYVLPDGPVQRDLTIAGEPAVYSLEPGSGPAPARHTMVLVHGDHVFRVEYQDTDGGQALATYRRVLRSLAFRDGTPAPDHLFDLRKVPASPAPGGIQAQDCCGYHDPHYNPYGCYDGNCVWWGRYKRPDTGGQGYPYWGNAQYWTSRAAEEGFLVDGTPETGALAGTPRPGGYIRPGWEHHVAYVESFDGAYVSFSDMDYGDWDCVIDRWSQPSWSGIEFIHAQGDDCPQSGGVILYWNSAYGCQNDAGQPGYWQRTAPGWMNAPVDFDDQASSLRVEAGWSVMLYELPDRDGASVCRSAADDDLSGDFFDGGVVPLDDQVSSLEVFENGDCTPGPEVPATLYEDPDYDGSSCALAEEGWANFCPGFNDVASSIRVQPGWSCRVYKHIDREGSSRCFTADNPDFSGDTFEDGTPLDDQVSSFEAFENGSCAPPCNPAAPLLTSPGDGAGLYPEENVVFAWEGDALEYQVHWGGGPGGDYDSGWLSNTLSLDVGLLPESLEPYHWQVQGRNGEGCEGPRSAAWQFRMGPLASSALTATAESCTEIALSWLDLSATESDYHLERAGGGQDWAEVSVVSGTAYLDSGLAAETAYSYRVRAHRHDGDLYSLHSPTAEATTLGGQPGSPGLVSPPDGSSHCDVVPAFEWSPVAGAGSYQIQVDDEDDFGSPEVDAATVDPSYTPAVQLPPGTYHWRVRAANECGYGAWSPVWTASFLTLPVAPGLLSPSDGFRICDSTPVLDWSTVASAAAYQLLVDNNPGFGSPAIKVTTSRSDYTSRTVLLPDVYYWRVRSTNACGPSAWSAVWWFELAGTCRFAYLPEVIAER